MRLYLILLTSLAAAQAGPPMPARASENSPPGTGSLLNWQAMWPIVGRGNGNGNGNGNVGSFNGNFNVGNGNGNFNLGSFLGNGELGDCRGNGGRDVGGFVEVGPPRGKVRCQCFMSNSTEAHACHGGGSPARVRP